MGIPLADNRGVNIHNRAVVSLPLFHLVDGHRNAVRNLLIQAAESFFPDHLSDDLALGLVRDRVLVVEAGTIGQIFENAVQKRVKIPGTKSGNRHDISEIADLPVLVDEARNVLFFHGVNLVNNQNHRRFAFSHALGDMLFTGPDEMGRLHEPEYHVHLV